MKKILFIILCLLTVYSAHAQRWYRTWRWEFIFQSATPEHVNEETAVRFSGFFNYGHYTHFNPSQYFGLFWGGNIRNTGFSFYYAKNNIKETRRVYTIGIPLAIKLGNMTKSNYLFAGGELELPFHYKQKIYRDEVKQGVYSEWLSKRNALLLPSIFVGYQANENIQLYVRYYCTQILNRSYSGVDFGDYVHYSDFDTYNVLNFAICITGIDRLTTKQKKEQKKDEEQTFTYR